MNKLFKRRTLRVIALFFAINILTECFFPTMVWALTAGPSQPEYASFEPVATTNMVNEFTGAFTYNLPVINVPGPNGSGYPLSLSYHTGASVEEEASWVGYGWTLNPGAINRGKQGVPDDYNNTNVKYWNMTPPNGTVSISPKLAVEAFSMDFSFPVVPTVRYNNYRGFGSQFTIQRALFGGLISIDYTVSGEEPHSFSASLNPAVAINAIRAAAAKGQKGTNEKSAKKKKRPKKPISDEKRERRRNRVDKAANFISNYASVYGLGRFGKEERAFSVSDYKGYSNTFTTTFGLDPSFLHIGVEGGFTGSFNIQSNNSTRDLERTGMLYAGAEDDYFVEKESPYNKRDRYLSIPHQAPDMFVVSGEGLSGTFNLVNPTITRSKVQGVTSTTAITSSGFDMTVGFNYGFGFDLGLGYHKLTVGSTEPDGNFGTTPTYDKAFRFNNDLGGNVIHSIYPGNTNPNAPNVGSIKTTFLDPVELKNASDRAGSMVKPGSSTYIGYSTVGDACNTNTLKYRSKSAGNSIAKHVTSNGATQDRIGELYTVNENGNTHIYGLPVFTGDEKALTYNAHFSDNQTPFIENNYQMWRNVEGTGGSCKTKVGEEHNSVYPTSHLLTQINTADYIDRKLDGATQDDFGGWTKFDYRPADFISVAYPGGAYKDKSNTNRNDWYHWRMPYTGMYYNKAELSDARDDHGMMQSGNKEIYYLKTIETKTHIAVFVTNKTSIAANEIPGRTIPITGSGIERADGCSAPSDEIADQKNPLLTNVKHLEKLERIEIYSKDDINGSPITTVRFDYYADGSPEVLVKGIPNSTYTPTSGGLKGGKLTLRRVWFEHEGVVNSKIAPYEFKYEYKDLSGPQGLGADIKDKYSTIANFANDLVLDAASAPQNPDYEASLIDGWGGNFYKGAERNQNFRPWLYQGKMPLRGTTGYVPYDPAAWQLKQIKLPSGGEILIQYEENDYLYVQNKRALAMASLIDGSASGDTYRFKSEDLGFTFTNVSDPAMISYFKELDNYLQNEKLYFKFLYSLVDDVGADITHCNVDYIDGYVKATAHMDAAGFYVTMENSTKGSGQGHYTLPFDACKSFVTRRKAGLKIFSECNQNPEDLFEFPTTVPPNPSVGMSTGMALLQRAAVDLNFFTETSCPQLSFTHSYLRVPTFNAKRGGGVRVKRIMMYDKGMEANAEVLYGTEYFYQNEDGTSSGVATNEPYTMHDESAVVNALVKRNEPRWWERVISGTERESYEGPLGESLLPSPSIGYRRVVTQNIHTGKTGTGFRVSEYYTAKEFPFQAKATDVDSWKPFPVYIPAIFVTVLIDERSVAQTYQFTSNNMHGQLHKVSIYGGVYEQGKAENLYNKTFQEEHEYFAPGEKVVVMNDDGTIDPKLQYMGREESVTIEGRETIDELANLALQLDISLGYIPPVIFVAQVSGMAYFNYELRRLKTAVVTKCVSHSAILKKVTTTQDGITHVAENKVFNRSTGEPVITVTYDGHNNLANLPNDNGALAHNGTYMNYSVPAHMAFNNMGQKRKNQGDIYNYSPNASLSGTALTVNNASNFVKGDLLRVVIGSNASLYYVTSITGSVLTVQQATNMGFSPMSGSVSQIEVINSGYTNQLQDVAARVTTYGTSKAYYPLISGNLSDSIGNVVSASTTVYSDNWSNATLTSDYGLSAVSDYQAGRIGKWRPSASYALKVDAKEAVTGTNRVYNSSGTYGLPTGGFSFTNPTATPTWIKTNSVSMYSPDGAILEEQNALNVKSHVVYGYTPNDGVNTYSPSLPVMVVNNAPYGSAKFLSYEDVYSANVSSVTAHSGKKSYGLPSNTLTPLTSVKLDNATKVKGLQIKFWAKSSSKVTDNINQYVRLDVTYNAGAGLLQPRLTTLAKVGEWTLYEANLKGLTSISYNDFALNAYYSGTDLIFIDDLKIQPYDASVTCYVYDGKTLRLMATLDEQHFGLYYQYNAEGKLIRQIVETEQGNKTVSETLYNVPKVSY